MQHNFSSEGIFIRIVERLQRNSTLEDQRTGNDLARESVVEDAEIYASGRSPQVVLCETITWRFP